MESGIKSTNVISFQRKDSTNVKNEKNSKIENKSNITKDAVIEMVSNFDMDAFSTVLDGIVENASGEEKEVMKKSVENFKSSLSNFEAKTGQSFSEFTKTMLSGEVSLNAETKEVIDGFKKVDFNNIDLTANQSGCTDGVDDGKIPVDETIGAIVEGLMEFLGEEFEGSIDGIKELLNMFQEDPEKAVVSLVGCIAMAMCGMAVPGVAVAGISFAGLVDSLSGMIDDIGSLVTLFKDMQNAKTDEEKKALCKQFGKEFGSLIKNTIGAVTSGTALYKVLSSGAMFKSVGDIAKKFEEWKLDNDDKSILEFFIEEFLPDLFAYEPPEGSSGSGTGGGVLRNPYPASIIGTPLTKPTSGIDIGNGTAGIIGDIKFDYEDNPFVDTGMRIKGSVTSTNENSLITQVLKRFFK